MWMNAAQREAKRKGLPIPSCHDTPVGPRQPYMAVYEPIELKLDAPLPRGHSSVGGPARLETLVPITVTEITVKPPMSIAIDPFPTLSLTAVPPLPLPAASHTLIFATTPPVGPARARLVRLERQGQRTYKGCLEAVGKRLGSTLDGLPQVGASSNLISCLRATLLNTDILAQFARASGISRTVPDATAASLFLAVIGAFLDGLDDRKRQDAVTNEIRPHIRSLWDQCLNELFEWVRAYEYHRENCYGVSGQRALYPEGDIISAPVVDKSGTVEAELIEELGSAVEDLYMELEKRGSITGPVFITKLYRRGVKESMGTGVAAHVRESRVRCCEDALTALSKRKRGSEEEEEESA